MSLIKVTVTVCDCACQVLMMLTFCCRPRRANEEQNPLSLFFRSLMPQYNPQVRENSVINAAIIHLESNYVCESFVDLKLCNL